MNVWEQLLIAFGGNAMLLVVLGFLARSLLQSWLAKDIRRFEVSLKVKADSELERLRADLKAKGDVSIEELKSRLQQAAFEHQVRFSKLHEKRAEVIADLYRRALEVRSIGERFVLQERRIPGEHDAELYNTAHQTLFDFYDFLEKHRIYLSEHVCALLGNFFDALEKPVTDVYIYGGLVQAGGFTTDPQPFKGRAEAFMSAYQAFKDDIPVTLKALEDEFRSTLGVETSLRAVGPK